MFLPLFLDIIHGKLDQKNKQLEIDFALGRDIRPDDIEHISETLQEWCKSCETVLECIEVQINKANSEKASRLTHQKTIEAEVSLFIFVLLFFYVILWSYRSNRLKNKKFNYSHLMA